MFGTYSRRQKIMSGVRWRTLLAVEMEWFPTTLAPPWTLRLVTLVVPRAFLRTTSLAVLRKPRTSSLALVRPLISFLLQLMLTIELPGHYVSKACEYLSQFVCRACFDVFCRWPALTMVEILRTPYLLSVSRVNHENTYSLRKCGNNYRCKWT